MLVVSKMLLMINFRGRRMVPVTVILATIVLIQVLKCHAQPESNSSVTQSPSASSITGAKFLRRVPDTVYQCEGRSVVMSWLFRVDGQGPQPRISWVRRLDGVDRYIMKRLPAEIYTYEEFMGRARYVYNAGLKLRNVSAADSGRYLMEIVLLGSNGVLFSLKASTSLETYSKAVCPAYSKYPKFNLTASGVAIETHVTVGIQEDLVLSHPIPASKPATSAVLYWRNRLWERNVFTECKNSGLFCSGKFNMRNIILTKNDTNVVFLGIVFHYRDAQPFRLEDWILIKNDIQYRAFERGSRLAIDSWVVVAALLLSSLRRVGEMLHPWRM